VPEAERSGPGEKNHDTSLAVWDVSSPVVAGRRATLKVGITCPSNCDLTGTRVDVYHEAGARVGGGEIMSGPWPGTDALYWTECDVVAPPTEGEHAWNVRAALPGDSHGHAAAMVRVLASRPPEHRVTLEVIEKGSGRPVGGVELRVGAFRTSTSDRGIAQVEVPSGTHDMSAWKVGYELLSTTTDITGDTTVRLEFATVDPRDQPYWM
jgi:hypothetical protein